MDHLMNILVRLAVFLSRFAPLLSRLGLIEYRSAENTKNDSRLHILLAGYNGARNTGSDVRAAEIARQIEERLGRERVEISVMTMDVESMRGYFDADVRLIPCSPIFLGDVWKACCASQAVILCEGSTLKSKFANALTLYSCEAAGIMKNQHKPCIAYGSEVGEMDAFLERTVRRLCRDTYFIARTKSSLEHIQRLGFRGHLGTDAAWNFDSAPQAGWADGKLRQSGWDGSAPLLGVAPVNPFWWPVRPSLTKWIRAKVTGDHSLQFQLWYFFRSSRKRKKQFEEYLNALARTVNEFAARHSCHIVLFGMEGLDADACRRLAAKLKEPVSVFLSADHDGHEMAALLRKLSLLITSRYHAAVLSMEAKVPCVAVSMDERLDNLMREMGMDREQLLQAEDPALSGRLPRTLEYAASHPKQIRERLGQELVQNQRTLDEMGDFLIRWLTSLGRAVPQPD